MIVNGYSEFNFLPVFIRFLSITTVSNYEARVVTFSSKRNSSEIFPSFVTVDEPWKHYCTKTDK